MLDAYVGMKNKRKQHDLNDDRDGSSSSARYENTACKTRTRELPSSLAITPIFQRTCGEVRTAVCQGFPEGFPPDIPEIQIFALVG